MTTIFIIIIIMIKLHIYPNLFNRSPWNSFFRVAYGFMPVGGIGDVDGDGVYTNIQDPSRGDNSGEVERGSVRFYVGIGTGW